MTRRIAAVWAVALGLLLVPFLALPAQAAASRAGAEQRQWSPDAPDRSDDADQGWEDDGADDESDRDQGDAGAGDGADDDAGDASDEGQPAPAEGRPQATTPAIIVVPNRRTIPGRVARIRRDGKAAIPRGAPKRIRSVIAAANRIVGKPYKWGGGHARLVDDGYDCSGTVGFALIRSGMLAGPRTSGGLARWGAAGVGRWLTVYANAGHVYMEVAGLRLDTSAMGDPRGGKGPRWRPAIGKRPGFHARRVAQ